LICDSLRVSPWRILAKACQFLQQGNGITPFGVAIVSRRFWFKRTQIMVVALQLLSQTLACLSIVEMRRAKRRTSIKRQKPAGIVFRARRDNRDSLAWRGFEYFPQIVGVQGSGLGGSTNSSV
jgi:hypothetical protein